MLSNKIPPFNNDTPKIRYSGYISFLFIVYDPARCAFTVINIYFTIDNQHVSKQASKNAERNLPLVKR